jgi:uncharacterized protein YcbX
MELRHLYIYPIKAFGPCKLNQAHLTPAGLKHDRRWMLIDPEQKRFISQRQLPALARFQTEIQGDELYIQAPNGKRQSLPLSPKEGIPLEAQIWESTVQVWSGWQVTDNWISELIGRPAQLVFLPDQHPRAVTSSSGQPGDQVSLADSFPFLLVGEASLDDLETQHGWRAEFQRFRPNFVVNTTDAFAEETWPYLQIGDQLFRNARPCPRCQVINVNPQTGVKDQQLLQQLGKWRKTQQGIPFGIHLVWENQKGISAAIKVGDPVIPRDKDQ